MKRMLSCGDQIGAEMILIPSRIAIQAAPSRRLGGFLLLSGILFASVVVSPFHREVFSVCLLKDVFGIPCPGCGITRAFLFLGHGDIRSAMELNANSLFAFSLVVLLWLHAAFNALTHNEIKVRLTRVESFSLVTLAAIATASGWIYNLQWNPWV
jgi:hypothetical protein